VKYRIFLHLHVNVKISYKTISTAISHLIPRTTIWHAVEHFNYYFHSCCQT